MRGEGMKVRSLILRASDHWVEGEEPAVHAEYSWQLIGNGLADEIKPKAERAAPTG
jgi:hypothetical protein